MKNHQKTSKKPRQNSCFFAQKLTKKHSKLKENDAKNDPKKYQKNQQNVICLSILR